MKNNIISVTNDRGIEEKVEIIKYFTLKSNGKDYIIYKDVENKNNLVYAGEVVETEDNIYLKSIDDNNILNELESVMESIKNG